MLLPILIWSLTGALAFVPTGKENLFSGLLLRELANRMNKESDLSYIDLTDSALPLGARSLEEEQYFPLDYDIGGPLHPSIRDQEFLQHSSLWGSQYMTGGAGEGKQSLNQDGAMKNRQEVKTDATLPSYCNPPNPCPVGYGVEDGCIEDFENSASFSRRFQASQDCMCDTEHMFDCPNIADTYDEPSRDLLDDFDFNRFIQHHIQANPGLHHKNLVAKKFHQSKQSYRENPFLVGERLPVAAKKGKRAYL